MDEEYYNLLDQYQEKFNYSYFIPVTTRIDNWDEIKKDIKDRIKNNNPQKEWDPKNDYLI